MPLRSFDDASVLIVDDQSTSRAILTQVVRNINPKISVAEKSSPEQALEWAKNHVANLVFVDYLMPEMNGIEFIRLLKKYPQYAAVPVIMITIKKDTETRYCALDAGVTDFINKPIDMQECIARSKNLMRMNIQHLALENKSLLLENLVTEVTEDIKAREKETLMRLVRAGKHKDYDTNLHLHRMSLYIRALADALRLDDELAETIVLAAQLHDIGKIGTPDSILLKKGLYEKDELEIMRKHPLIGFKILEGSPSKYLQMGGEIALSHHEHYDGSGYPNGTEGEEIPLSARIVAVADVFDALTSTRPYKKAWSFEQSYQYICDESGKQFDPTLVNAMIKVKEVFERIYSENSTSSELL